MRLFTLATAASISLLTGCNTTDHRPANEQAKEEVKAAVAKDDPVAQQPLTGKIGGADWTYARAFAYVPNWAPDKIVIGMFDFKGPTGCRRLPDGDIVHNFASEEAASSEQDEASVTIDKAVKAPWTATLDDAFPPTEEPFEAEIANYNDDGTGSNSRGSTRLEITELTNAKIVGAIRLHAASGDAVEGTFEAIFCTDGWQ